MRKVYILKLMLLVLIIFAVSACDTAWYKSSMSSVETSSKEELPKLATENARIEPSIGRPLPLYDLEQTLTHDYECSGRRVEITGAFNKMNTDLLRVSVWLHIPKQYEAKEITHLLVPYIETQYALKNLEFFCDTSGKIYLMINNTNPWSDDRKPGDYFFINEKNEVVRGSNLQQ